MKSLTVVLICFALLPSVLYCQDYSPVSIAPLEAAKPAWMDSISTLYPESPLMSKIFGDNPYQEGFTNPWGPTTINRYYLYVPYDDTLEVSVASYESTVGNEMQFFLMNGYYKLEYDSQFINKAGIYILTAAFCDSTFKRNFIVMK